MLAVWEITSDQLKLEPPDGLETRLSQFCHDSGEGRPLRVQMARKMFFDDRRCDIDFFLHIN